MAENLHDRGIFVTIVEMADQVMNILDYEMAAEVHQHLKTKNVEFYLSDGVKIFSRSGENLKVSLQSGRTLEADMAILSIGVRPENKLARESGLDTGKAKDPVNQAGFVAENILNGRKTGTTIMLLMSGLRERAFSEVCRARSISAMML